jgi:predicted transcriptional regulator
MREQGKSIREIARALGVDHMTVSKYLGEKPAETEEKVIQTGQISPQPPLVAIEGASSGEKMEQKVPIFRQEVRQEPAVELKEEVPEVSGVRGVAESLGMSHMTIVRSIQAESAIKKYPALGRLEKVSDILELVKVADFLEASPKEVEGAVKLVLDRGLDPVVAMHMQRVAKKHWNGIFKVYEDGKFPVEWLREAVSLMRCNPEKDWPVDMALKAVTHAHKEYRVRFWNYMAVRALGEAASKVGLTEEQYIAIAALEKLHMEGFLSDIAFDEFVRVVKEGGYRPQI